MLLRKQRLNLARDRVISAGQLLRELEAERDAFEDTLEDDGGMLLDEDARYLNKLEDLIQNQERKRDRALDFIKTTNAQEA